MSLYQPSTASLTNWICHPRQRENFLKLLEFLELLKKLQELPIPFHLGPFTCTRWPENQVKADASHFFSELPPMTSRFSCRSGTTLAHFPEETQTTYWEIEAYLVPGSCTRENTCTDHRYDSEFASERNYSLANFRHYANLQPSSAFPEHSAHGRVAEQQ